MEHRTDLLEVLNHINPVYLSYQDWVNVGMALKEEGYSSEDWDAWSRRDPARYHPGECNRKWNSFQGTDTPVTGGTIVQLAREQGWEPDWGHELGWDDIITQDSVLIDQKWVEGCEVVEPDQWDPAGQIIKYLETLFEAGENVGYVVKSWKNEKGKYVPQDRGNFDRTAGQLIEELSKCSGDVGGVLGDYDPEGGAWIRFNPLDGNGVRNSNVTEFRYALVESDGVEIEKQNSILRELELPIACLVHSGGKSLHAIVKIDAADFSEYRKRVDYLYDVCQKNGLQVDTQNRNPSRLSRMPGIMRGAHKQFLVDTNIGKSSWAEWRDWIDSVTDELPDPDSLKDVWDNIPELSPCLIDGVLRQGHKMLLAGPSKAGKSFLQIELCIAIAEGMNWLGWQCTKGRVMYVNLELDRASCLHRFQDVYRALGWPPRSLQNIDIWNLRGKSVPMDKLAPKLIRRASKKDYIAIVIDPIYKVITGDENSADQMAKFCNQFDKVCTELGCSVVYCHHHSKGSQSAKKSMDRASGSGVFARDPDALLDLIELETTEALMKQEENKAVCAVCRQFLDAHFKWKGEEDLSQDDLLSSSVMMNYCENKLDKWQWQTLKKQVQEARERVKNQTAWRIDGTLREFPKFEPVNLWFKYPIHVADDSGALGDIQPEEEIPAWRKKQKTPEERKQEKEASLMAAFEASDMEGTGAVKLSDLVDYMGITLNTVKKYVDESKNFKRENGMAVKVSKMSI